MYYITGQPSYFTVNACVTLCCWFEANCWSVDEKPGAAGRNIGLVGSLSEEG